MLITTPLPQKLARQLAGLSARSTHSLNVSHKMQYPLPQGRKLSLAKTQTHCTSHHKQETIYCLTSLMPHVTF